MIQFNNISQIMNSLKVAEKWIGGKRRGAGLTEKKTGEKEKFTILAQRVSLKKSGAKIHWPFIIYLNFFRMCSCQCHN